MECLAAFFVTTTAAAAMAAAAGSVFRLLLAALLLLSHLPIFSSAVPVTRTGSLAHGGRRVSENGHLKVTERMAAQLDDYPGSGANNRHTPRPQLGRGGCVEC